VAEAVKGLGELYEANGADVGWEAMEKIDGEVFDLGADARIAELLLLLREFLLSLVKSPISLVIQFRRDESCNC
jgi:hypothetical protein